jgi:hypothetical protein
LNPSNADTLAMPTAAALLPSGQDALCARKTTLVFGRNPRVDDLLPIAGRGQSLHPQIHPHSQSCGRHGGDNLFQNQRNVIPATGLPNDRDRGWERSKASTPVNLEPSQTRNHEVRVLGIGLSEPKSRPRIFGRLAVSPLLELGIPSLLAEKAAIGRIEMPQGLLSWDRGDLTEPSRISLLLPLRQLGRTTDEAYGFATLSPSLLAPSQRPVIHIPATAEDLSQGDLLTLGRIKPKPVTNLHREKVSLNATTLTNQFCSSPRQAIGVSAT